LKSKTKSNIFQW